LIIRTHQERKASADIFRILPHGAKLYREAVRELNTTLTESSERPEARALIRELLGSHVMVRQEGAAVYARLEIVPAFCLQPPQIRVLLKSITSNLVAGAR